MPQMNPMNWLVLFLYFSLVFVVCLTKIHFTCTASSEESISESLVEGDAKKFLIQL